LSITAAGVGITLTEASTVIFAELHWTPATMQQAEDRAHRIGQRSCVNCHYLVGENTLDEILYMKMDRKLGTVGQMIDGCKQKLSAEEVERGKIGKFSKA
jgi:SWI/SNF-related matrix-associated actin-dependent regulator 1 of chromatin subfamily A